MRASCQPMTHEPWAMCATCVPCAYHGGPNLVRICRCLDTRVLLATARFIIGTVLTTDFAPVYEYSIAIGY